MGSDKDLGEVLHAGPGGREKVVCRGPLPRATGPSLESLPFSCLMFSFCRLILKM